MDFKLYFYCWLLFVTQKFYEIIIDVTMLEDRIGEVFIAQMKHMCASLLSFPEKNIFPHPYLFKIV